MICSSISSLIGFTCHPLSEDGSVAMIETPFLFEDGDGIPVFVEKIGKQVRFFDDGGAILHLMGRGLSFDDHRKTRFIKSLADPHGVSLNDKGELEIFASATDAPAAFSKYVSTMLALAGWERDQNGASADITLFIEEVAICLQAWKAGVKLGKGPSLTGISGRIYKLDFDFDGAAVLAIGTHPATFSYAASKLLDIRGSAANENVNILVVIDDRLDAEAAKSDGLVLDAVGTVMMMSRLEKNAGVSSRAH